MNLNHPDFLNSVNSSDAREDDKFKLPPNSNAINFDPINYGDASTNTNGAGNVPGGSKFNDILFQKLSNLDQKVQNPSMSPRAQGIPGGFEFDLGISGHRARDDDDTSITHNNSHDGHNRNSISDNTRNSISDNASIHSNTTNGGQNQLPLTSPLVNPFSPQIMPLNNRIDSFNLPLELQGGVGNISSRRPSYAAESFTRSMDYPYLNLNQTNKPSVIPESLQEHEDRDSPEGNNNSATQASNGNNANSNTNNNMNLAQYASLNNYSMNHLADSFNDFNLNSNFNDFQSRRPSQLVDFAPDTFNYQMQFNPSNFMQQPFSQQQPATAPSGPTTSNPGAPNINMNTGPNQSHNYPMGQMGHMGQMNSMHGVAGVNNLQSVHQNPGAMTNGHIKLDNGLLLKDQYLIASADLKNLFNKTIKYFQNVELSNEILEDLKTLLGDPKILKLVTFIKNLNNLTFNHKILCLVMNKNGKFDLLSYPNNSNIFLQKNDLVIVDGDRGKDLVMILEPLIDLNFAILFNFLKKIEYLKSLNIIDEDHHHGHHNNGGNNRKFGGTHSTKLNASFIVNNHSNEDNEFIITLPTKQVLRFATPKEIHKISGKFLEEKKAFITCYNKIKELNLQNDLQLINVEYQSDFKKLIFYYFANFKRIDFRGLIKELFKIYKTRIWLCAVLPYDNGELIMNDNLSVSDVPPLNNSIPVEYNLSNDQILDFSINQFGSLPSPNYFHSRNFKNLVELLKRETNGPFYGFGDFSTGTKP